MAGPSPINPLGSIIKRQYNDTVLIKNTLFKERLARARNLYRKDLLAHYGCVNAIEFSTEGELLISGGDDRRVLLWSVPEAIHDRNRPICMQTNHMSNIFCLAFDSTNTKIFSGGNDDQVIVHDANTGHLVIKLQHRKPVYGLSIHPHNDYVLATAGDDGRILVYDIRESNNDPICLAKQKTGFHSVMFNPTNSKLLVTANSEEGITLWDSRKSKEALIHYDADSGDVSGISACFNSTGANVLALRRRLPPVLYNTNEQNAVCQFYNPMYYNSCTMKTCSFAGDNDEYILSGSDDFNLYMWKIPTNESEWGKIHVILKGHRSIVNQVRYNKHISLIASSGVEKMVKLWSTLPIGGWSGSLLKEHNDRSRPILSHDDYIYLVGQTGQRISHDYSDQSIQEDTRMLAFFDSLIQREIEGWESPSQDSVSSGSDSENDILQNRLTWDNLLIKLTDEHRKHKPNKIAQLIAKRKWRLAKMAQRKASSNVKRHKLKDKNARKLLKYKGLVNTKHGKSNGSNKKLSTKPSKVPSTSIETTKELLGSTSGSLNIGRKHKIDRDKSEKWVSSKKYRTRQSIRDMYDTSSNNSSFDAPSTSTGITASGNAVFRVIEQDSDEEVPASNCNEHNIISEENFINILPTPLNGTHDMLVNVLEMSNGNTNVNSIRTEEFPASSHASTSSSTSIVTTQTSFASTDNCDEYHDPVVFINGCATNSCVSDTDSNCEYYTPIKMMPKSVSEIDSGFATGPCSSGSVSKRNSRNHPSCSGRSNGTYNDHTSEDDEYPFETFKKRVKKARLNIRKQICGDSDSN